MLYSLQEQWDRNNVQKYSQSHSCVYYKTAETYQMAHIRMMKKLLWDKLKELFSSGKSYEKTKVGSEIGWGNINYNSNDNAEIITNINASINTNNRINIKTNTNANMTMIIKI